MQSGPSSLKYSPHIDGLRALAVGMVILFHFGLGVSGGFTGVDVFFVISGFLITSIIRNEIDKNSFSLARFWERRARRILPALSFILAVISIAGWYLLLPGDFKRFGEALFTQAFFAQNVVFWKGEGYFSAPAENQPLLHTWSLALEEQFYLVFPILILLCIKFWKFNKVPWLLAGLAIYSFLLSWIGIYFFPSASFYFLPTRAWELLLGALIAWLPAWKLSRMGMEAVSGAGLLMILASSVLITPSTPFPGYAALLPVLGAALLIGANRDEASFVARLLAWKPFVGMGLISYSLYLWHWPAWVFYKYWNIGEISGTEKGLLIGLCFLLAILTWKFIEQPFRKGSGLIGRKALVIFSAAILPLCLLSGLWIINGNGMPKRFPQEVLACDKASREESYRVELKPQDVREGKLYPIGVPSKQVDVFVWGDSLAMALLAGLDSELQSRGATGLVAAHSATPPLMDFDFQGSVYSLNAETRPFAEAVVSQIAQVQPKHVIIAGVWSGYFKYAVESGAGEEGFMKSLKQTLTAIRVTGAQVWIVAEPPQHKEHIPKLVFAKNSFWIRSRGRLG